MTTDPAQDFDFEEFLISDEFVSFNNLLKSRTAIVRTTGSLSTIASILIIIHILRSHHGLSTTYHRLVFGLSIGDILAAFFGYILDSTMAPKELNYVVPFAMGNQTTCDAQGFLLYSGSSIALAYNMSICFYYLSIISFNKKEDYIRKKLEPWLHGVSIVVPLATVSTGLAINGYNSSGGACWFVPNNYLPHCWGLKSGEIRDGFSIPCGRGDGREHPTLYLVSAILQNWSPLVTPVVIVVTMALMYRSVRKVEKKMQKYGVNSLRLKIRAREKQIGNNYGNATSSTSNSSTSGAPSPCDDASGYYNELSLMKWFKKMCIHNCCTIRHSPRSRSNTVASHKRAILSRAFGYVVAWGLSWIPLYLLLAAPLRMTYIFAIFHPLQGLFNFAVYMRPKVINAKNGPSKRKKVIRSGAKSDDEFSPKSWCQSIVKAYISRGPRKKTSGLHHATTNSTANGISSTNHLQNVLKKFNIFITAHSRKKFMNISNQEVATTKKQMEKEKSFPCSGREEEDIRALVDAPQHANDDESPAPATCLIQRSSQRNSHACSLAVVLAADADELGGEDEGKEFHLHSSNDKNNVNIEFQEVDEDIYFVEEIQSTFE